MFHIGPGDRHPKAERWALALAAILALVMFMYRAASDGLMEMGDGVNHYLDVRLRMGTPDTPAGPVGQAAVHLVVLPICNYRACRHNGFNAIVAMVTA
ncbi:MAG: hypothetical protein R2818_07400 [Flavobacteriales bacterium]